VVHRIRLLGLYSVPLETRTVQLGAALEMAALEMAALEMAALEMAALEMAALEMAALEMAALEMAALEMEWTFAMQNIEYGSLL
jgi:hypothetical protein